MTVSTTSHRGQVISRQSQFPRFDHHAVLFRLILEAESEADDTKKRAAEGQCIELILKLWSMRDQLPEGAQPLGRLKEAIEVLAELHPTRDDPPWLEQMRARNISSPWFKFTKATGAFEKRLFAIGLLAGVLETEFGEEVRWVKETPEALTEDDHRAIDSLNTWLSNRDELFESRKIVHIESMTSKDREATIVAELQFQIKRQQTALDQLKKELKTRRSSPPQTRSKPKR